MLARDLIIALLIAVIATAPAVVSTAEAVASDSGSTADAVSDVGSTADAVETEGASEAEKAGDDTGLEVEGDLEKDSKEDVSVEGMSSEIENLLGEIDKLSGGEAKK